MMASDAGPATTPRLPALLSVALVLAYAVLTFFATTRLQGNPWAIVIGFGPIVLAALLFARKTLGLGWLAPVAIALLALMVWAWPHLHDYVGLACYMQYEAFMLIGAVSFGHTLFGARTPLCTLFASYSATAMTPALLRYTRQVTLAWTLFFIAMATISTVLFFLPLPRAAWSAFDTFATPALLCLMFVAEYSVRRRVLPSEPREGITSAMRAYWRYRNDSNSNARTNNGKHPQRERIAQ